jgi:hypothetical protein
MKPPLKLSEIEQEHLQELFDQAGVARDELPYTPVYDKLIQDFQDRTFKNADGEQVFGALLKYGRTGSVAANPTAGADLPVSDEQLKSLKAALNRHAPGGKILPYSDAFSNALKEFNKSSGLTLSEAQFWQTVVKALGSKRRPPPPRKRAAPKDDDEE